MIPFFFDYATPSVIESTRDEALLGIAADRRRPVRFHARLARNAFLFRVVMRAFGEAVWSTDAWRSTGDLLDPVVTVHPDCLLFEAFSQDQSSYVQVKADAGLFVPDGDVRHGTTNIDFTAWLWAALAEIRTTRETWLRIGSEGFEVKTTASGGRFEKKVSLPEAWVRGFLHLQAAMAMPGTRLTVRPVDLLAPIRFLRYTKARVSPRALRYELTPGTPPAIVLEPWEERFPLKGADPAEGRLRTIRTWGRHRLRLVEPVLPFAESVEIHLKGRAMPSFYVVKLPGLTFTLGLSSWSGTAWSDIDGFATLEGTAHPDQADISACLESFRSRPLQSLPELMERLSANREQVVGLTTELCRQGRLLYDLDARTFRFRELFPDPIDHSVLFPPSPRLEEARRLLDNGGIRVTLCEPQETRRIRRFKTPAGRTSREVIQRDWRVTGICTPPSGATTPDSADAHVEIVVQDNSRIIFGTCHCAHFREHLLTRGPCAEMLALFQASSDLRRDLPVSEPVDVPGVPSRLFSGRNPDDESAHEPGGGRNEPVDESEEDM